MKRLFIIMILLLVPFGMYASDNIPFYYNCQADEGDVPQEKFCEDLKASFVKIGALDFIPANSQVDAFFFTEIMPTRSEATEGYMFVSMVGVMEMLENCRFHPSTSIL